jgi:NAD(P)-dependent dehydrogenase (short-subunit alcohol dehydrogenase family)
LEEFVGRVSVVTGAASGIGFGIAEKCAREGMKVVLADIETNATGELHGFHLFSHSGLTLNIIPQLYQGHG